MHFNPNHFLSFYFGVQGDAWSQIRSCNAKLLDSSFLCPFIFLKLNGDGVLFGPHLESLGSDENYASASSKNRLYGSRDVTMTFSPLQTNLDKDNLLRTIPKFHSSFNPTCRALRMLVKLFPADLHFTLKQSLSPSHHICSNYSQKRVEEFA